MPELPEVETIRKGLTKHLKGLTIKSIEINKPKQFRGNPVEVIGQTVLGIRRFGKITAIDLTGDKSLLIHLKMTGQLVFQYKSDTFTGGHPIPFAKDGLPGKTTHIIFHFTDGSTLFFNDVRQFGWIKIVSSSSGISELEKIGPEPFTKEFTAEYLGKILTKTAKAVKLVLMDQEKIAGVGNIYANDALFEAGILPQRPAKSLSKREIEKLFQAIEAVLAEGIRYGGSTSDDEAFVNVEGERGGYQNHVRVYQKDGQPCPNGCDGIIQRAKIGGRGTFFCPHCQK
jgi:formamidopyrimidine-DNA glycosylase